MSQWLSVKEIYQNQAKQQRDMAKLTWEEKIRKVERMRDTFLKGGWERKQSVLDRGENK